MEDFIKSVKGLRNFPIAKDHEEIMDYITKSTCSYDELILQISNDKEKMAQLSSLIEASTEYYNSLNSLKSAMSELSDPSNLE